MGIQLKQERGQEDLLPSKSKPVRVMIVAGEASGDQHARALVEALKKLSPECEIFGMGGRQMRSVGVDTVVDSEESASVMGVVEVIGSLGKIYEAYKDLISCAKQRQPDVAVLIDFPDFNFFVARALKKMGIKTFYFIAPQVWAWRKSRVKTMRRIIDEVATIFPFESDFYEKNGVSASFVGHPFAYRAPLSKSAVQLREGFELDPLRPVVAFLPGSRHGEISRLLTPMLESLRIISKVRPGVQAILPVADSLNVEEIREALPEDLNIKVVKGQAREVLAIADVAVLASGTVTMEAALAQVPSVVVYKLAPFTYFVAKRLVKGVNYIAMPNLILKKKVYEELIQDEATPEMISVSLERMLGDEGLRLSMKEELAKVKEKLMVDGDVGHTAASRAAERVLELAKAGEDT
ncbi:lipid-A-disaccharide synthase [bacterium J17]|nr:lipid-A-disaccharide synthase [bacterium J17]